MTRTPSSHTALLSALAGALFVGFATALVFALALAPAADFPFGFGEVALAFVMGGVFGTIAGGVAGASEVAPAAQTMRDQPVSDFSRCDRATAQDQLA